MIMIALRLNCKAETVLLPRREMTKPAVIKSSGVIIQPLKYTEGVAEEQRKVQKTKSGTRQAVAKISSGMAQTQKKRRK